jgi:hypothetical protein
MEVINEPSDDIDGHCPVSRRLASSPSHLVNLRACPHNGSAGGAYVWWWISAHGGGFQPEHAWSRTRLIQIANKSSRFFSKHYGTPIAIGDDSRKNGARAGPKNRKQSHINLNRLLRRTSWSSSNLDSLPELRPVMAGFSS